MPYKIVHNSCYGGPCLSAKAIARYNSLSGKQCNDINQIPRHCPYLVQVVEEMGKEASGYASYLVICEINENQYTIEDYDGIENVKTPNEIGWISID